MTKSNLIRWASHHLWALRKEARRTCHPNESLAGSSHGQNIQVYKSTDLEGKNCNGIMPQNLHHKFRSMYCERSTIITPLQAEIWKHRCRSPIALRHISCWGWLASSSRPAKISGFASLRLKGLPCILSWGVTARSMLQIKRRAGLVSSVWHPARCRQDDRQRCLVASPWSN